MSIKDLTGKAYHTWRTEGLKQVVSKTVHYLTKEENRRQVCPDIIAPQGIDICAQYAFIAGEIRCGEIDTSEPEKKTINWFVPDLGAPGAGGHVTISRCICHLTKHGYKNRIYFYNTVGGDTREPVKRLYDSYYSDIAGGAEIYSAHFDEIYSAEAAVATAWQTAYFVKGLTNARKKFYFVQDFEPWFFPHGSEYAFAENTYRFGFIGITASPWLKERLEADYGMKCHAFGFSYDKDIYFPRPRKEPDQKQILVYTRPSTARRAFELAMLSCWLVSRQMPDIRFVFIGAKDLGKLYELPFDYVDAGIATQEQLAEAYSQSDICMALSCSNVSLLPLEIMGCRSVVLSNDDEQVHWLQNGENSIMVPLDPNSIAEAILEYLGSSEKLEKLRENGYAYASRTSWEEEFDKVAAAMDAELAERQ